MPDPENKSFFALFKHELT